MYQDTERNPIVRNYVNNLPGSRDNPESIANFYSPLDSPQGTILNVVGLKFFSSFFCLLITRSVMIYLRIYFIYKFFSHLFLKFFNRF